MQLSGTEAGAIYVFDGRNANFICARPMGWIGVNRGSHAAGMGIDEPNIALILAERDAIQVADLREEAPNDINEITLRAGYLARLVAPLRRGEDVVGFW